MADPFHYANARPEFRYLDEMSPLTRIRVDGALPSTYAPYEMQHHFLQPPVPEETLEFIRKETFLKKFLEKDIIDHEKLREICWQGTYNNSLRASIWKIVLDYSPKLYSQRDYVLLCKKEEYNYLKQQTFSREFDEKMLQIIRNDVKVFGAYNVVLFRMGCIQESLTKCMFVYCVKNEVEYSSRMFTLLIPFYLVFISQFYPVDSHTFSTPAEEPHESIIEIVEADAYWCLSALVDKVPDIVRSESMGLNRMVSKIIEILSRFEPQLVGYIMNQGVDLDALFKRWVTKLFLIDFPLNIVLRLWDGLISELDGPAGLCMYLCAVLVIQFKDQLMMKNGTEITSFLSNMPAEHWTESDMLMIFSHAYLLQMCATKQEPLPMKTPTLS